MLPTQSDFDGAEFSASSPTQSISQRITIGYAAMTVARIFLGVAMMPYAIAKLVGYQFKVPAWSYAQPLGMTNGSTLAWATFGYSLHLQILLGLFELVPAILLLSVRTRRLGALFMFPVLLNVVLINFFLDLWPTTKSFSLGLLLVNCFLVLYDWEIYVTLLKRLLAAPAPIASRKLRLTARFASLGIGLLAITLSALAIGFSIFHFQLPVSDFTGMHQINGNGTWKIRSLTIAGLPINLEPNTSLFFNLFNTCVYGTVEHPNPCVFTADKSHHTFEINQLLLEGSSSAIKGEYKLEGNRLLLSGARDNQTILLDLERAYPQTRQ